MSRNNGLTKPSQKGLLTPHNCIITFIDHQPQMLFGTSNFDRQSIINSTVALAKATRTFDVAVVLTTVETKAFSGNMWPQLKTIYPQQEPIERSSMNSWDDTNFVAAVEKSGKKKIVLCGLWTETCVALPTVQAIHDGYEVYVVEDCCGDVSQLARDNAMKRIIQVGAKPVRALSVTLEWQRDWALRETYDAVMDLVKNHYGAETDATRVATYNPFVSLHWLITGKTVGGLAMYDEDNRLDRMEALRLYTVGSSWFSTESGSKGAIIPRQLADLAVLSADYFSISDDEIKNLQSVLTIVGGKPVYGAEEFKELDPALPPVLPEWSPVEAYGGYAKPVAVPASARVQVAHTHTRKTSCSKNEPAFGCLCWAF